MNNNWIKASEKMPERDGEYLVVIITKVGPFVQLCDYNNKDKEFICWDDYNDDIVIYKQEDIDYWMEVPEYKNLKK